MFFLWAALVAVWLIAAALDRTAGGIRSGRWAINRLVRGRPGRRPVLAGAARAIAE